MLPPILEIYVLWHPDDSEGERIADWLLDHFHGTPYVGLIGGAVEVYTRSVPWGRAAEAPRPLPFQEPLPHGLPAPRVTAVVPILGVRLARAVESDGSPWKRYISGMLEVATQHEDVGIFPIRLPGCVGGDLTNLLGGLQALHASSAHDRGVLCREISQQVAQMIGAPLGNRLTVFISHTKRHSPDEEPDEVDALVARVRSRIAETHLEAYFDDAALQPGSDWAQQLLHNAASNSLLAVRTDLFAGREWCQAEFRAAKQAGMPVVTLSAVRRSAERGSFLMDHVPVVGYRDHDDGAKDRSIDEALNLLVDGALRRALWRILEEHLPGLGVDWAPPEAPEPVTAIPWLQRHREAGGAASQIVVMHPDPPLGPDEAEVMEQLFTLAGLGDKVSVVTPRTYAGRGGRGI